MTAQERSDIGRRLTVMLTEISDIAYQVGDSAAQTQFELGWHHLNRAAMEINRIAVHSALQSPSSTPNIT